MTEDEEIAKMKPVEKALSAFLGGVITAAMIYGGYWLFTKLEVTSGQRLLWKWAGGIVCIPLSMHLLKCIGGFLSAVVTLIRGQAK